MTIAKKFKDSLNYRGLIINNKDFYGSIHPKIIPSVGVFVKYIIDHFGVEAFKKILFDRGQKKIIQRIFLNWILTTLSPVTKPGWIHNKTS